MAESNRSSGRTAGPAGAAGSARRTSLPPGSGRRQPVQPAAGEPLPFSEAESVAPQEQQPAPRVTRSGRRAALPSEGDVNDAEAVRERGTWRHPALAVQADVPIESPAPQPPVLTASGRTAAQVPSAGSRTTRRAAPAGPSSVKKKVRGVGKELVICFGIIAVLAVAAMVIFVLQRSHNRAILEKLEEQKKLFENNMSLGFDTYQRAENAGKLYVMGKDDTATDDKLFGSFKSDDKIYNIIFDRIYKDRRNQTKTEQKSMFKDRLKIESIESKGREENGVSVIYGLAEDKSIPIVIAKKFVKPAPNDSANLGGTITVIAKAEWDHVFENAKKPRAAPEKDKVEKKE